ncbi:MAG: molecular chaperone HtpG [Erysipelotrichaceae bacterium]|nr:molecular chaperone HtpG [Erysipelotrichaceae bacterium]MDP3305652.1 molecular chaperone HtpG [Erysipelotrichaceae bacterium]
MSETMQFQAESKRLLELMIHSIYTHKEIFLRELISNASDALDKIYFLSLEDDSVSIDRTKLSVLVSIDKENRTLTISDNGIGMTKDELRDNLGTIAKSGSLAFKQALAKASDEIDIIGQFGVGFYSAFMVSQHVTVITRSVKEEQAYRFESSGSDGFTIEEGQKDEVGTIIICKIKENSDDENYDEFLESYRIKGLVKQYSDYIRYPIQMLKEADVEDDEEAEKSDIKFELETLNSMTPLWRKSKADISDEDYNKFYKDKFHDWEDPAKVIHMQAEGNLSYQALLFIPSKTPFNFYSNEFEKGLQLYSKGVFIMDKAKELLGDHFRFVRGLVDSPDFSLNISREILQHDRQLKAIASRLEKKIKSELLSMLKLDREAYEKFWKNFGMQIKYGIYQDFGTHRELLEDLVLFTSSRDKKLISLEEYVARMPEDQKEIYFVAGDNIEKCEALPQSELVREKGYEILYLVDDIDEFVIQIMHMYKEKPFKSINQGDLNLLNEDEKSEVLKKSEESKDLFASIKEALGDTVEDVRISTRLKSHPVCLVSSEGLSFEMEKVLSQMPDANEKMKAKRILEINPEHPLLQTLRRVHSTQPEKIHDIAWLLYDQACLMEGLPIEDPMGFSKKLAQLMIDAF